MLETPSENIFTIVEGGLPYGCWKHQREKELARDKETNVATIFDILDNVPKWGKLAKCNGSH